MTEAVALQSGRQVGFGTLNEEASTLATKEALTEVVERTSTDRTIFQKHSLEATVTTPPYTKWRHRSHVRHLRGALILLLEIPLHLQRGDRKIPDVTPQMCERE